MVLASIVLAMCALAVTITESKELVVVSIYPDSDNFSYIGLVCVYDSELYNVSQSGVTGASFQLNGTEIEEEIESVESLTDNTVRFLLTQEKEGFFTCSRNGLLSNNSIGLAAQPSTDYSMLSQTYEVELPDANTIVSTELECDIQPGALRQRYSVQWKVQYNDTFMIINKNSFNLSLSIDSSLNGSQYRCEVTIDHDGERVNRTYEGRTIIIITTEVTLKSYLTVIVSASSLLGSIMIVLAILVVMCTHQYVRQKRKQDGDVTQSYTKLFFPSLVRISCAVLIFLLLFVVVVIFGVVPALLFVVVCGPMAFVALCIYGCKQYNWPWLEAQQERSDVQRVQSLRPSSGTEETKFWSRPPPPYPGTSPTPNPVSQCTCLHSQDSEKESHTQQGIQRVFMRHDDTPPPPYPGTAPTTVFFNPMTTLSQCTHLGTSYHDEANDVQNVVPQSSHLLLPDNSILLPSSNRECEWHSSLSDEQNDFGVNVASVSNVAREREYDSLPDGSEVSTINFVREVHLLSETSQLTSSDTVIRQGKVKRESGCEGQETELYGRVVGRDGMEECPALTCGSVIQQEYEIQQLPNSGSTIDPLNTREYIPKWFSPVATLSQCTHDGRHYHDEANNFSLEIPEGAIPEGESITIDIGVALYGPFQYPQGLRPVSPVFWLCVRDNKRFHFSKPVTVTLSHFLNLKDHDDIQSLGLSFLKGDHEMNLQQMYNFQSAEGDIVFQPLQMYSMLQTIHFCSLCISSRDVMESLQKASFCMTAMIPCTFSFDQPSFAFFFITFEQATCLNKLDEQIREIPEIQGNRKELQKFEFKRDGNQAMTLVLHEARVDSWIIGPRFNNEIQLSDVDFFVKGKTTKSDLDMNERRKFYPPRFRVVITCTPTARHNQARVEFKGATKNLVFVVPLTPPPPQATPTSPGYGSITSNNSLADESTSLGIDDLIDVKAKLVSVAPRWRDIGLVLGIADPKLATIEANKSDVKDKLMEMLRLWLNKAYNVEKHGEPTWQIVREAVKNPVGGECPALADKI